MKNKTFLLIAIFTASLFIIPQITFAAWWKPNTWKIFNKKYEVKTEQKIIATSTPDIIMRAEKATTTEKIEPKNEDAKKPKTTSVSVGTNSQNNEQSKEIERLKRKIEELKQNQIKIIEKIIEKPVAVEKKENSSSQIKKNENIVTLPSGSVVEMDANGNIVRTIKEAIRQIYTAPAPTTQNKTSDQTQIPQLSNQNFIYLVSSVENNIPEAVMPGASSFRIGFFNLENKDKEDINLSNIKISINYNLGKNINPPIWVFVRYPIDLFGVSNESVVTEISDKICTKRYKTGTLELIKVCDEELLAKLENISIKLPNNVIIEKGKKIKLSIGVNIIADADRILAEQAMIFKSCDGYGVETQKKFECNQQNIPGKNLNIAKYSQ